MKWKRISDEDWVVAVRLSGDESVGYDSLCVLLTNFVKLYRVQLTKDEAMKECTLQRLTKLEFERDSILKWLGQKMEASDPEKLSLGTATEDNIELILGTEHLRRPFKWVFQLEAVPATDFFHEVMEPPPRLVEALLEQRQALFKMLEAKDAQIHELEASGGKLSAKKLKTRPFDRVAFLKEPLACDTKKSNMCKDLLVGLFTGDLPLIDEQSVGRLAAVTEDEETVTHEAEIRSQEAKKETRKRKSPKKPTVPLTLEGESHALNEEEATKRRCMIKEKRRVARERSAGNGISL